MELCGVCNICTYNHLSSIEPLPQTFHCTINSYHSVRPPQGMFLRHCVLSHASVSYLLCIYICHTYIVCKRLKPTSNGATPVRRLSDKNCDSQNCHRHRTLNYPYVCTRSCANDVYFGLFVLEYMELRIFTTGLELAM